MSLAGLIQSTEPMLDQQQVNGNCVSSAGSIRLNLGGRETKIEGFLNVDLQALPTTDIVADVRDLSQFEDGSVTEIYASHLLEHFPWFETDSILKEWRRVLKTGGIAYISVPDFGAMDKLFHKRGLCQYIVEVLMGEHRETLGGHMNLFDFPRLSSFLIKAGFSDVRRITWMPYGVHDCSEMVDSLDRLPISVSVKAIA